jgi:hypothetical protein
MKKKTVILFVEDEALTRMSAVQTAAAPNLTSCLP